MVRLVQLVEHQIVVLGVVGSSPTSHPKTKTSPSGGLFISFPAPEGLITKRYAYFASFLASFRRALEGAGSSSVLTTLQRTVQLTEAPGARVV